MQQTLSELERPALAGHEIDLFIVVDAAGKVVAVEAQEIAAKTYANRFGEFEPLSVEKATVVIGRISTVLGVDEVERVASAEQARRDQWYADSQFDEQLDEVHARIQPALDTGACDVAMYRATREVQQSRPPTSDELHIGVISVSADLTFSLVGGEHCAAAATALEAFANELLRAAENLRQAE